jgi:hypothetical protein
MFVPLRKSCILSGERGSCNIVSGPVWHSDDRVVGTQADLPLARSKRRSNRKMLPFAHLASVSALRDFQSHLVRFRHDAQKNVATAANTANTVWQELESAYSRAVDQVHAWRDRLEQTTQQLHACRSRSQQSNDRYACQYEQVQVEASAGELARAEARVIVLLAALERLSQAMEVFRIERACLDRVLDIDLTEGDQFLRLKLSSIELYLFEAHRR